MDANNTNTTLSYSMFPGASFADEDGVWFCHLQLPIMFYFDFSTNKVTVVKEVPMEFQGVQGESFAADMVKINNKLYIAPYYSKSFFVYDILSDTFESIMDVKTDKAFRTIIYSNDELILFPCKYEYLVRYNIKTRIISYDKLPFSETEFYIVAAKKSAESVFCAMFNSNSIWRYHLIDGKWDNISVEGTNGFNRLAVSNDKLYLHEYAEDRLICVKWGHNCSPIKYEGELKNACAYRLDEDYMLINSETSGELAFCDAGFQEVRYIDFNYPYALAQGEDHALCEIHCEDSFSKMNKIYCDHHILFHILDDGSIKWSYLQLDDISKKQLMEAFSKRNIIKENGLFSLEYFLELV